MATYLLLAFLGIYRRFVSPVLALMGAACRFEPTCSRYAQACVESHGALRGGLLSIRRLCKCHPFHPGGFDPPPPPLPPSDGRPPRPSSPPLRKGHVS